jgi:hypothetical protein
MIRRFVDPSTNRFCILEYDFDADIVTVTRGTNDVEESFEIFDDPYSSHSMPGDALFESLVGSIDPEFVEVLPDNLLDLVEENHEVSLTGRLRDFYEKGEYKQYQGFICQGLDCRVNFVADAVIGLFYEEFYDSDTDAFIELMPISSVGIGEEYGYEDEQHWIGVDPSLPDGPVYELFTSNAFEVAYPNLDAFLADLLPLSRSL